MADGWMDGALKPKIGFVGLGQMGRHIAANLLKAGYDLTATSSSEKAFEPLENLGAKTTMDIAEVARCDMIFLALPDAAVVQDFMFGQGRLASRLKPGQVVVDLGTTDYSETISFASKVSEIGSHFVDAPISGMEARARDGTLTIMCGASREIMELIKPVLQAIGKNIVHMGDTGAGQLAKLINQLLFDVNAAALAEIMPLATKLGLNPATIAQVVNSGTGKSYASEFFLPNMLAGKFDAGYPMKAAYKDLISGARISSSLGVPTPVLAAATATYQTALLKGYGAMDKGAMIKVFEELLNVKFRNAEEVNV